MRSTRTMAEFEAQAMLLGYIYDPWDHTFEVDGEPAFATYLCADTMEPAYENKNAPDAWNKRREAVAKGELGASDAETLIVTKSWEDHYRAQR